MNLITLIDYMRQALRGGGRRNLGISCYLVVDQFLQASHLSIPLHSMHAFPNLQKVSIHIHIRIYIHNVSMVSSCGTLFLNA
jgi:hypothetical protein